VERILIRYGGHPLMNPQQETSPARERNRYDADGIYKAKKDVEKE